MVAAALRCVASAPRVGWMQRAARVAAPRRRHNSSVAQLSMQRVCTVPVRPLRRRPPTTTLLLTALLIITLLLTLITALFAHLLLTLLPALLTTLLRCALYRAAAGRPRHSSRTPA